MTAIFPLGILHIETNLFGIGNLIDPKHLMASVIREFLGGTIATVFESGFAKPYYVNQDRVSIPPLSTAPLRKEYFRAASDPLGQFS